MARIARIVAPGYPHHITQRGNRRQQTFFSDDDYRTYLDLMSEWCRRRLPHLPRSVERVVPAVRRQAVGLLPDAQPCPSGGRPRERGRPSPFYRGGASARSHLLDRDDPLLEVAPMRELVGNWAEYLARQEDEMLAEALRRHERTGRVLGSEKFVDALESTLAHPLKPGKRGRKPKGNRN
ncbi:MAG: hypothetical protein ACOX87_04595 [Chloroflexota bacterium]